MIDDDDDDDGGTQEERALHSTTGFSNGKQVPLLIMYI